LNARHDVAGLQGKAWLNFLSDMNNDFLKYGQLLLAAPYQRQVDIDLQPLFLISKKWIKQRRYK